MVGLKSGSKVRTLSLKMKFKLTDWRRETRSLNIFYQQERSHNKNNYIILGDTSEVGPEGVTLFVYLYLNAKRLWLTL